MKEKKVHNLSGSIYHFLLFRKGRFNLQEKQNNRLDIECGAEESFQYASCQAQVTGKKKIISRFPNIVIKRLMNWIYKRSLNLVKEKMVTNLQGPI